MPSLTRMRARSHRHRGSLAITGATVLTPAGLSNDTTLTIDDGRISGLGAQIPYARSTVSVDGLLLLPGLVDIHGDAFERALCPRPGVELPLPLALRENDSWLLSAGVTTFFCALTDSFEPGLRSRAMARTLIDALSGPQADALAVDTRIHLRHERCLTDGHDELLDWLRDGLVHLLSTADHLPLTDEPVKFRRFMHGVQKRLALSEAEIAALMARAAVQRDLGLEQLPELAACAHEHDVPLASHDDDSAAAVDNSLALGVAIAEFPTQVAWAQRARRWRDGADGRAQLHPRRFACRRDERATRPGTLCV